MADIQIVYREGFCELCDANYDIQCCLSCGNLGCEHYRETQIGDCVHAKWKYKYKGWSGKRYDMEEIDDYLNPHMDSMSVKLGNAEYDCVKVILDGKCIYDNYSENS